MISTTRLAAKQDAVEKAAAYDDALADLTFPLTTTSLGLSTTVVDTRLVMGSRNPQWFDKRIIEIIELVTNGPAIGEIAGVDDGGLTIASGTLTVSPAYTNPVQTGTDYLIYPTRWSPGRVENGLNRVLRQTEHPALVTPSLADDPDFDANDLTNWAAVGTPTTREFVTTAVNVFGWLDRALRIVSDAIDEGATTANAPITENEPLNVWIPVSVQSGSVKVILQSVEGGTGTDRKTVTINERDWTAASFTETMPDNADHFNVRFLSGVASSEFYVGPIIVQSAWKRVYLLPSWVVREDQVSDQLYIPSLRPSEATDSYLAWADPLRYEVGFSVQRNDRVANPMRVELATPRLGKPLLLQAGRPFAALTADTSTTTCDRDWLVNKALSLIYQDMGDYQRAADFRARAAAMNPYGEQVIRMGKEYQLIS